MIRERLAEAIQLRETGRARQDKAILEEARTILLDLIATYPDDAEITFQTAVVHDNLGLEQESIPFYVQALVQGLSGADLERALLGLGNYQQAEETLRRGCERISSQPGPSGLSRDDPVQYAALQAGDGTRFDQFDGDNL